MSPPAFLGANLTASYNILIQELMVGGSNALDADRAMHLHTTSGVIKFVNDLQFL